MKKLFFSILLHSLWIFCQQHYITFDPGTNRLGDQLMTYVRAKWVAHKYNLTLLLPTNVNWELFMLSTFEIQAHDIQEKLETHFINNENEIETSIDNPQLYISDFNLKITGVNSFDDFYLMCKQDTIFTDQLKKMLSPKQPIISIELPQEYISVACHIRKGGGFDAPLYNPKIKGQNRHQQFADKIWPTKFPPDHFYIQALHYLKALNPNKKLFVYIFTDDKNPEALAEKIRLELKDDSLSIRTRTGAKYVQCVVDDLINMSRFNYLIRPQSSFSRVAQLIGDHDMTISPISALWEKEKLIITSISRIKKP